METGDVHAAGGWPAVGVARRLRLPIRSDCDLGHTLGHAMW